MQAKNLKDKIYRKSVILKKGCILDTILNCDIFFTANCKLYVISLCVL